MMNGRELARAVEDRCRRTMALWQHQGAPTAGLHVVLVGNNPASGAYVRSKQRACERTGIRSVVHALPDTITQGELLALLTRLGADDSVDALLVQLPLPPTIAVGEVMSTVPPDRDVDGFHPSNLGLLLERRPRVVSCTPLGCMRLLAAAKVPLEGARAVVVGRSMIVGTPMALLLNASNATVTLCHRYTSHLADVTSCADILVVAAGVPGLIGREHIKPGAAVVDVGQTKVGDHLVGDVDHIAAEEIAGWLTPVPGGVGPMTVAMLMENTVQLAAARRNLPILD